MKWNHEFKLIENDKTFRVYESENKRARIDFFDGMTRVAIYDTNSYILPTFSICPPNFIMPRNGRDRLDTSFLDTIEINSDSYNIALCNIKNANLCDKINVYLADALEIDINLLGKYDLIFIDAAKAQYINFFNKFKVLLNDN